MNSYMKAVALGGLAGGLVVGLGFLVAGSGALSGRDSAPAMAFTTASQAQPSHDDMHRMMDAVHGDGTSQRMHEAMGPSAYQMRHRMGSETVGNMGYAIIDGRGVVRKVAVDPLFGGTPMRF